MRQRETGNLQIRVVHERIDEVKSVISRRSALSVLAASPLLIAVMTSAETSSADSRLLALGRDFDAAAGKLDHAITTGIDFDNGLLEQLDRLDSEIVTTQASTMQGLSVKARAACWALLGDLDDPGDTTTDRRMSLSIVRDLIRLCDPGLERPGALKQLLQDIESSAGNSVTGESTG
jgi:hypothetical protein